MFAESQGRPERLHPKTPYKWLRGETPRPPWRALTAALFTDVLGQPVTVTELGWPPVIVGRSAEQSRINRLVADAKDGRTRSLVLRGEAGIGKTALLDYAESVAGGMRVLRMVGSSPRPRWRTPRSI